MRIRTATFVPSGRRAADAARGSRRGQAARHGRMNVLMVTSRTATPACGAATATRSARRRTSTASPRTAVRFDSAYVQAVCCNPSRTSFLTGLRPLTHARLPNSDVMSESLPPGTLRCPSCSRSRGFTTAVIGKLFHTVEYAEQALMAFRSHRDVRQAGRLEGPGPS